MSLQDSDDRHCIQRTKNNNHGENDDHDNMLPRIQYNDDKNNKSIDVHDDKDNSSNDNSDNDNSSNPNNDNDDSSTAKNLNWRRRLANHGKFWRRCLARRGAPSWRRVPCRAVPLLSEAGENRFL